MGMSFRQPEWLLDINSDMNIKYVFITLLPMSKSNKEERL